MLEPSEAARVGHIPLGLNLDQGQSLGSKPGNMGKISIDKYHVDPVIVAKLLFNKEMRRDQIHGDLLPPASASGPDL